MGNPAQPYRIGVIGAGDCSPEIYRIAYDVGQLIAKHKAVLICGGLGGVMEAASKGALENGGITIGILPTRDPSDANPYITLPIPTGLGHARNIVVVQSSQIIVAIDGRMGTLSELAIALKVGIPVIGYKSWEIDPSIRKARTIEEIAQHLEQLVGER